MQEGYHGFRGRGVWWEWAGDGGLVQAGLLSLYHWCQVLIGPASQWGTARSHSGTVDWFQEDHQGVRVIHPLFLERCSDGF